MTNKKKLQYFSNIIDTSCIIAVILDSSLRITYANKGAELVSGYKKNEIIGKKVIGTFIPKKFQKYVLKTVMDALRGIERKLVVPIVTKSGEERILCWKGKIQKDENGKKIIAAFAHDITEEIETKKSAQRNETLYKQLIENSFALIYTKDTEGRYLSINPAWKLFKNVDPRKVIGKTDSQIFGKKVAEKFRSIDERVMKTQMISMQRDEIVFRGKTFYQNTVKYPLRDEKNKVIGICGISHDITDHVEAEKKLYVFQRMFEQTSEGMAITTLDGILLTANDAWTKMHGYKNIKEITGKHIRMFHSKKQFENDVVPFNKKLLKTGHASGEIGHVKKKGEKFQTFMTTSILKNEKNKAYALIAIARNITKEKIMERELKESETRYRNMFKNIQTAVVVYKTVNNGEMFTIIDINPRAEKIEKVKRKEIIGKKITEVFPGVEEFGLLEVMRRVWLSGKSEEFPMAFYKDKRISGWRENFIYKLPSGEIVAAYADLTKRKIAEDKLRESEERYRALIETAPNGVLICDKNENLIFINKRFGKMIGYGTEEVIGKNLRELTDEKNFIKFKKGTLLRMKGISSQYESEFINRNGKRIPVLISAAPLIRPDGEYESSMSVITNISDLKIAEKALRESEIKYRSLFNNLSVGVYRATFGPEGKFIDANPALCRILGYESVEEIKNIRVCDIYQNPAQRIYFTNKIARQGVLSTQEIHMKKKDGTPIMASDTAVAVRDKDGTPLYFDGILEDVTERKELEEKIKCYAEHLEKMVLVRTRELEEKTREALKANKFKSDFLATVSHELRTPLTSIIGYTELLEDDLKNRFNMQQLSHLEIIKKNANQLLQLISDILDLTKIEKRKMETETETFKISEVLEEIQSVFKPLFLKKGVSLQMDIESDMPETMTTDRQKLKHILFNLTSNALKFTPHGKVNIRVYRKDGKIMFEIKDTGIGIDESEKEKIFETFQRTDNPLVRRMEGSGLGLVITKKMVNLLRGTIDVESRKGEGSSFTASFPIE